MTTLEQVLVETKSDDALEIERRFFSTSEGAASERISHVDALRDDRETVDAPAARASRRATLSRYVSVAVGVATLICIVGFTRSGASREPQHEAESPRAGAAAATEAVVSLPTFARPHSVVTAPVEPPHADVFDRPIAMRTSTPQTKCAGRTCKTTSGANGGVRR